MENYYVGNGKRQKEGGMKKGKSLTYEKGRMVKREEVRLGQKLDTIEKSKK